MHIPKYWIQYLKQLSRALEFYRTKIRDGRAHHFIVVFLYSVKTNLSIEEMEKISLQYCGCLPTLRGYITFPFMSQTNASTSTHFEVELQLFIMLVVRTYFHLYLKYNGTLKIYWIRFFYQPFINLRR